MRLFATIEIAGELPLVEADPVVDLENSRIQSMTGFDSGQTYIENYKGSALTGMPRLITYSNDLELAHNYDANNRLLAVNVRNTHRVRLEYDKLE